MPEQDSQQRKPLRVWVLSDGTPGHMTASRAIVKALARRREVAVGWIDTDLRWGGSRRLLRYALNRGWRLAPAALRMFYRNLVLPSGDGPDVVVASGGKTSFLAAALGLATGAEVFYAGTLRGLSGDLFTATVAPVESGTRGDHIQLRLPAVDMDWPAEAQVARGDGEAPRIAVLLGGRTRDHRWDSRWKVLGRALETLAGQTGAKLLLTTSRRTGARGEGELAGAIAAEHLEEAVWYGKDERNVVGDFLGRSDLAIVTEDSMAMTAEAVTSRRPVIVLRPDAIIRSYDWRNTAILDQMTEDRRILRMSMDELDASAIDRAKRECVSLETDPIDDLAEALDAYLPQDDRLSSSAD